MLSQNKSVDSPSLNCHNNDLESEVQGPLPTPMSQRLICAPKSAQSIHWTLSPMKNLHYDRTVCMQCNNLYEFTDLYTKQMFIKNVSQIR